MSTRDLVEKFVQEQRAEARREGHQEASREHVLHLLAERFGPPPADVAAIVGRTGDLAVLRAWLKVAAFASLEEALTAIRGHSAAAPSAVFEDADRLRRQVVAAAIVRSWQEGRRSPCATCRALTQVYLESAVSILAHNNRIEENVRIEGDDLVLMDAFDADDPRFHRVFPSVQGNYYQSADGRCPECGVAWRYEYDAHGGIQGVLRTSLW